MLLLLLYCRVLRIKEVYVVIVVVCDSDDDDYYYY